MNKVRVLQVNDGFFVAVAMLAAVAWSGTSAAAPKPDTQAARVTIQDRLDRYAPVKLTADLSQLSVGERRMIPLLIAAAKSMDAAFWVQAYGDRDSLLKGIDDSATRRYVEMNYGPWDRLDDNVPFVTGVGKKRDAANFYPADMSKSEFETALASNKPGAAALKSTYTMVRRGKDGQLEAIPYHQFFRKQVTAAASMLSDAMTLAEDPGLKRYLKLRAKALVSDEFMASDMAWLDMKNNGIDVVIGPIETYEDRLFGYKASYEAYVLIKDKKWSRRLAGYAKMLPALQSGLPVEEKYKSEKPGSDSDLNAYDVIYYAGDCNAGAKTIAINLPNDERVQLEKGTRRLQLKNAMRAKFDKILVPIADLLIAEDQRKHITFDAFFSNTMFHEVAHGLGIKHTITNKGTVREALRDQASALEEGKADILGLHMVTVLFDRGKLREGDLRDNYVTFLAGIFRSVRFGTASAHGRANMLRFNYFQKMGAFTRDKSTGTYRADFDKMRKAITALTGLILKLQGDGDYAGVQSLMREMGSVKPGLRADLDRLAKAKVPVDIVFEQGMSDFRK